VASNRGGDTGATILIASVIEEVSRTSKTTDPMDQPNRMVDRGKFLARNLMVSMLVMLSLLTGCRPGDHICQIIETSLR
jgi:hypothetical protein